MPATIPRKTPKHNATLTAITRVELVEDEGGSVEEAEVTAWSGSVPAFVRDRSARFLAVVAESIHEEQDTEIVIPWRIVRDHVPDFDVGDRLVTSRGEWRVVSWIDNRDYGFIRTFCREVGSE